MGLYLSFFVLPIVVALQSSLVPLMRIDNGQPDFVLLLVAAWAVRARWSEAIVWAFVGGVAADLLSVLPTGTSVVALLILVFAIRAVAEQLYGVNVLFLLGFVLFGTVLQETLSMLVLTAIGFGPDLVLWAEALVAPTLFYNLVLTIPVYIVVRLVQRRLPGT